MKDLRVVFMGTPEFSVPVLEGLIEKYNVVLVVTKEDAPVGRKRVLTPSPISDVATNNSIPVFKPHRLKSDYKKIIDADPDIIITCAYGQIVPKEVLDYPGLGCVNVHASLLPKYRGASPISQAIIDGETETGITIMYMDETLDTGNIINARSIKIEDSDTYGTLSEKLSVLGRDLLLDTLPSIVDETNFSLKQDDEEATYVGLLKREDERLDFSKSRLEIINKIRGLNPSPTANIVIDGEEWKVLKAESGSNNTKDIGVITEVGKDYFAIDCMDGKVLIKEIKPFGKKIMSVKDFFNGYKSENLLGKRVDNYEERK